MYDKKLIEYFSNIPEIDFVIAYGSYGRGEASYLLVDGKPKLYNDIDLILITNSSEIKKESLEKDLKKILNVRWVDILFWTEEDFSKKRDTIFFYDLMSSYKVLKGNQDYLEKITHDVSDLKISPLDVYDMFVTRSWSLLSLYGDNIDIDESLEMFQSYQCAKLIIAMTDFALLSNDLYTSKISDKLILLNSLKGDELCKISHLSYLLNLAIEVKNDPNSESLVRFLRDQNEINHLSELYYYFFFKYLESTFGSHTDLDLRFKLIKYKRFLISLSKSILKFNSSPIKSSLYRDSVLTLTDELKDIKHCDKYCTDRVNWTLNRIL
ncbi:hypothetical protein VFDL14_15700 [Vibrio fortis]|uniref:Polymerase beta nucleotidyltransferase domain-containing protein n=1 Tax=Vibrio fortis TaxID=212667 RepID=A0A066US50_9VIBR|nr:nucleotidyltransferase domain-containing protein [Vibrio fortis]KDN28692.1 hypothetical protein VFDL14_15700 [Vibrio fortis]